MSPLSHTARVGRQPFPIALAAASIFEFVRPFDERVETSEPIRKVGLRDAKRGCKGWLPAVRDMNRERGYLVACALGFGYGLTHFESTGERQRYALLHPTRY